MTNMKVKGTESCSTLCDPMDCSPPNSSIHGILQARMLEQVTESSPGDLSDPGIEPRSRALQADALPTESPGKLGQGRAHIFHPSQSLPLLFFLHSALFTCYSQALGGHLRFLSSHLKIMLTQYFRSKAVLFVSGGHGNKVMSRREWPLFAGEGQRAEVFNF